MTCGCSRHIVRTVDEEVKRDGTGILDLGGQEVTGYVLAEGTETSFSGRVRLAEQDSLIFWAEQETVVDGSYRIVEVIGPEYERSAVESLKMSELKTAETILLTVGTIAGVFVGIVAIALDDGPIPMESN